MPLKGDVRQQSEDETNTARTAFDGYRGGHGLCSEEGKRAHLGLLREDMTAGVIAVAWQSRPVRGTVVRVAVGLH